MSGSILMMMECKSQDRNRKANNQEIGKFSVHQSMEIKTVLFSAVQPQSSRLNFNTVSLVGEGLNSLLLNLG